MIDDVEKIVKSNKKIEDIIILENELNELRRKIGVIDAFKDQKEYDKLKCEEAIKEMNLANRKRKLDKYSLSTLKNISIFYEYNRITEKMKMIEKKSKKSENLVETVNSEGRKKEIDSNFVDFYNSCVEKKKRINKEFKKSLEFLSHYKLPEEKEEVKEKEIEHTKVEEQKPTTGYLSLVTKKEEPEQEEVSKEKNSGKIIPFFRRVKKYALGAAIGIVALASLITFGGAKENKNVKNTVKYETEDDALDNSVSEIKETETTVAVDLEQQIDNMLDEEEKLDIIETDQDRIEEAELDKVENPTLGDNLKVSDSSKIMRNQYDATNYENGRHPYFDNNEQRTIQGVVYQMPDGTIKTARSEAEIAVLESIEGAQVTAYLTYSQYGVEGFYSIQDVVLENNVKTLSKKM